jgi:hypothetical protein
MLRDYPDESSTVIGTTLRFHVAKQSLRTELINRQFRICCRVWNATRDEHN